jgi:hypothetical protein
VRRERRRRGQRRGLRLRELRVELVLLARRGQRAERLLPDDGDRGFGDQRDPRDEEKDRNRRPQPLQRGAGRAA